MFRTHIISSLRRSERYARTDISYLARGGFWSVGNFILTVGFGFLTTVVLANWVAKDILGTYQFVLAMASILSVCTLSGMGTAVARDVARGHDGSYRYGRVQQLHWSRLIILAGGAIGCYYWYQGDQTLAIAFLIVGAATPLIESFKLYEEYLRGKEAFKELVTLGFWRKPIPLVAVTAAAWFSDDVLVLLGAYFSSHVVSYGLVHLQVHRRFHPPYEVNTETLTLSKHLSVIRLLSQITSNLDKIVIWHFLGPIAVAGFVIAQTTTRYAAGLVNSLTAIAFPKLARQDFTVLQKTLPRKVWLFTGVMLLAALVYAALVPLLFAVLFPEYPESILIAQLLAALFVFTPCKLFTQALVAHNALQVQYVSTAISPVAFVGLLWYLTPTYGLLGVTLAVVAISAFVALLSYVFFVRHQPPAPALDD